MLVLRDTLQFFGTAESPSPTPHVEPGEYRPVLTLNHLPTLLAVMISIMVWRLAFPSSPRPLGVLMALSAELKLTPCAGLLVDLLFIAAVYSIFRPPRAGMG